jgi:hypothetical protein
LQTATRHAQARGRFPRKPACAARNEQQQGCGKDEQDQRADKFHGFFFRCSSVVLAN